MANTTTFDGINKQLKFSQTAPVTINDTLVRALTGLSQDVPSNSTISFADLSGKYGVGPFLGNTSNSQASYFPVTSIVNLTFVTNIYNANIIWSSNTISGSTQTVLTSNSANASLSLTRSSAGNSSANVQVTATLYYGNTLIGSNSVYVNLFSEVYSSGLDFSSTGGNTFSVFANGYSSQTAQMTITAQANIANANLTWTVTPNNASVSITGNSVTLTSTAKSAGVTNAQSFDLLATISYANGQVVAVGGVVGNVSASMYVSDFVFSPSANALGSANNGPLTISVPVVASGNAPGSVIAWSLSQVSGSNASVNVSSDGLTANVYLTIASNSSSYGTKSSVANITATMYTDNTESTVVATHSALVSLEGLVYGATYTPPANVTASGYTAQTAVASSSVSYKAGALTWIYTANSGKASISQSPGVANGANATLTITDIANTGSNSSVWTISPKISSSDGAVNIFLGNTVVSVNATVLVSTLPLTGPTSNTQYANSGPVTSSATISISGNTPAGTNVTWSATKVSGSNASLSIAADKQSANLYLTVPANTFVLSNAVYQLFANCYDISTGDSISSAFTTITLKAGTYGLTIIQSPSSNSQSGYTAQTATATISASIQAGGFAWVSSNTSGPNSSFSSTGVTSNGEYTSSTGIWTQNQSVVGTNTVVQSWQVAVYDLSNTSGGNQITTTTANNFTLTAQQNAYSLALPSNTTNTQILTTTSSNLSILLSPTCNISGYSISSWVTSNTTNGYSFSSNSTTATAGFAQILSSSNSVSSYTTNVTGNLLDANNRVVQSFSIPVILRSYYPNVSVSAGNSSVSGYTAQTASGNYVLQIWDGATGLSVATSNTGDVPTIANGVQNTSYQGISYSLSTGNTYQNLADTITFQPTIQFYEVSSSSNTWAKTVSLTANNYNPAASISVTTAQTVAGWTGAQTASAVVTASANASISNSYWTWGSLQTGSGTFSGNNLQGTGNNQYIAYVQKSTIGVASATGNVSLANLYVDGTLVATTPASNNFSISASLYDPALVISGPSSNTQSNLFSATSTIVLTASANTNIPNSSYTCSVTNISGSPNVAISSGNSVCTLSVKGVHTSNAATANVVFKVYSNGTLIETASQQVTLSATGTIPSYSLSVSNTSAAGFNFAQTASTRCTCNGVTSYGDYCVWTSNVVSGSATFSTPGGSNSYVTSNTSRGTIGTSTGIVYQICKVYDPDGVLITTLTSPNYQMQATVYNPAFTVSSSNGVATGWGATTSSGTISLGANSAAISAGAVRQLSLTRVSGSIASTSISSGNTNGSISVTATAANVSAQFGNTSIYSYSASLVLNGQTISGPVSGSISATANSYMLSSSLISTNSGPINSNSVYAVVSNWPSSFSVSSWSHGPITNGSGTTVSFVYNYTNSTNFIMNFTQPLNSGESGSANVYATVNLGFGANTLTIPASITGPIGGA